MARGAEWSGVGVGGGWRGKAGLLGWTVANAMGLQQPACLLAAFGLTVLHIHVQPSHASPNLTHKLLSTPPIIPRRFGPRVVYLQQPQARHYRDFVLIVPPRRIPLHPNLAAALFKAAHGVG